MNEERPMPLLCIVLFSLFLLPLAHSCDNKPPVEDYTTSIRFEIEKLNETLIIATCPARLHRHKLPECSFNEPATSIYNMTCFIRHMNQLQTYNLVRTVLNSLNCSCPVKPTREPKKRRRRTTGNIPRLNRETKKRCKVKLILKYMTECYNLLNSE